MINFSLLPQTVVFQSQQQLGLMSNCNVDLSDPDYLCTINALIVPGNGNTFAACRITAEAVELVRLCQLSVSGVLSAAGQHLVTLPTDGVYDCDTAGLMLQVAELIGQDVGAAAQWPLGRTEMRYLLGSSQALQALARQGLQPSLGFVINGVVPLISSDPSVGAFVAAQPPFGCSPAHLHLEEPEIAPSGLEAVNYLDGLAPTQPSQSGSGIGFVGGTVAGIALAVGSAAAYEYWKEHRS